MRNTSSFDFQEKIHLYEVAQSTNILAREALETAIKEKPLHHHDGNLTSHGMSVHGSIFVANKQTAGKGRQGRSFFSPQDTGLYMSVIIVPPKGVANPAVLTATTAVAVCKALEEVYRIQASIKWVNDIFYKGKKIGGILAEGIVDAAKGTIPGAVVGIGLNLIPPPEGFPAELDSIASSVFPAPATSEQGATPNLKKNDLVAAIVTKLLQSLELTWHRNSKPHLPDDVMEYYRKNCLVKPGCKVQVFPMAGSTENSYTATCLGIDHQVRLHVQKEDGSQVLLNSGEVSLQSQNFTNR